MVSAAMDFNILLARAPDGNQRPCTPLTPADCMRLQKGNSVKIVRQPSAGCTFDDASYLAAGISVADDAGPSPWVLGLDGIDPDTIAPGSWVFLSSLGLFKGWSGQSRLLERLQTLGCTLIDVELIPKPACPSWARFTGLVAMADCLHVLGVKLTQGGIDSPLDELMPPGAYGSAAELLDHLERIGDRVSEEGLPEQAYPLMVSVLGSGKFADGIDRVLERFPLKTFSPHIVLENVETFAGDCFSLYQVLFSESDLSTADPDCNRFEPYLPMSTIVINTLNAVNGRARLLTREYLRANSYLSGNPFPRVVADLTGLSQGPLDIADCQFASQTGYLTYIGKHDRFVDGIQATGTSSLACRRLYEVFPGEASTEYSSRMAVMLEELFRLRQGTAAREAWLPDWLRPAMIVDSGRLTGLTASGGSAS